VQVRGQKEAQISKKVSQTMRQMKHKWQPVCGIGQHKKKAR
jgi:hypothetical protein